NSTNSSDEATTPTAAAASIGRDSNTMLRNPTTTDATKSPTTATAPPFGGPGAGSSSSGKRSSRSPTQEAKSSIQASSPGRGVQPLPAGPSTPEPRSASSDPVVRNRRDRSYSPRRPASPSTCQA